MTFRELLRRWNAQAEGSRGYLRRRKFENGWNTLSDEFVPGSHAAPLRRDQEKPPSQRGRPLDNLLACLYFVMWFRRASGTANRHPVFLFSNPATR
jgi:hypothetical protein